MIRMATIRSTTLLSWQSINHNIKYSNIDWQYYICREPNNDCGNSDNDIACDRWIADDNPNSLSMIVKIIAIKTAHNNGNNDNNHPKWQHDNEKRWSIFAMLNQILCRIIVSDKWQCVLCEKSYLWKFGEQTRLQRKCNENLCR